MESEREINLVNLFWAVCLRWRSILAIAVAVMVLAGAISGFRGWRETTKASKVTEESASEKSEAETPEKQEIKEEITEKITEKISDEISEESLDRIEKYYEYVKLRDAQKQYNENSPLMQLNAMGFYAGKISYYVENYFEEEAALNGETNNVNAMIAAYTASLGDKDFRDSLYKMAGDSEEDAALLIEAVDCMNRYGNIAGSVEKDTGIMRISVYAASEKECRRLANLVKKTLENKQEEINNSLGEHRLVLIGDNNSLVSDNSLLSYQKSNIDRLADYEKSVAANKDSLSEEEKEYIEILEMDQKDKEDKKDETPKNDQTQDQMQEQPQNADTANEPETAAAEKRKISVSGKYIVLGFIGGGVLGCFIAVLLYLLNNKLRMEDDVEAIYGIKLYGCVEIEKKMLKKKWFGAVDRLIIRLRDRNKHKLSPEQSFDLIVSRLKVSARHLNALKIYITGTNMEKEEKGAADRLIEKLSGAGVELQAGDSVLYDAKSLEKSAEIGNVLLMERVGLSAYDEIRREVEQFNSQGIHILGMVMVE